MNRMMKILVLGVLAFLSVVAKAQDVSYSQTYEAPVYLSPSFTGLTNGSRIGLNYRNQWPGIGTAFQNYAVTFDHFVDRFNSGVGLMWQCDNQGKGLLVDNEISFNYAYEFAVSQNLFIRPGIVFHFGQRKIDQSKMVSYTDITAEGHYVPGGSSIGIDRTKTNRLDAGASVMVYNDDYWAGITVDHLMQPEVSFTDVKDVIGVKTTFFCGYKLTYEDSYRGSEPKTVTFALNYKNQRSFNQLELGAYWYYNPIEIGVSYRGLFFKVSNELSNYDAIIPNIGINVPNMPLRLGYSYDMTLSDVSSFGNGAHEVSLVYRLIPSDVRHRSYKMKPVPCTEPIMGYSYTGTGKKHGYNRKFLKK